MKKKYSVISGVLILFCLLTGVYGCSSSISSKKAATDKNDLKTLEASGTKNTIKVGDNFKVVLKGNPSTGYAWNYTIDSNDVIKLISKDEVQDKSNVVGSPSTFTWNFKSLKAGQVKLTYKYYQGWLGEAATTKENTIEYLITVTP